MLSNSQVVAVTGASGYIGKHLVKRLLHEDSIAKVVGIDVRPMIQEDPKFVSVNDDITRPLKDLFTKHGVDTVVHLAFVLRHMRNREKSRQINVGGAINVLSASKVSRVQRIVLLSSATVYGAHPDNPALLDEDDPLRPPEAFNYANDKMEVERIYHAYVRDHPQIGLTTLRGCVVMGPNADNFITGALNKPVLIGVGQSDPRMQFIHHDDLVEILWRCISESHPGTFNVAAPGAVSWSEIAQMSGKKIFHLPTQLAYGITNLTWKLHIQNDSPGVGLDWIRWPWQVSTARLQGEFGYTFKHTSLAAVQAALGKQDTKRTSAGSQ